ncbi:MAG: FxLYD domain-containing protein [Methanophagales archaeon]|nr:FxLYD domain-containing protein [Methanophagales archaeon]
MSNTTEPGVVILNDTSYISASGYFHVVGEVENNLPANIKFVKINAIFYDEYRNMIGTDYTYTMLDFLQSNQKSPFDLIYLEKIEPASYELSVTWDEAPFEGLEITSHRSYITSSGYHHVVGAVKNNGSEEAEYVKVVCTYYNSDGNVIGAEFTYTDPSDIEVNETAIFDISSFPRKLTPSSYELQVQGR